MVEAVGTEKDTKQSDMQPRPRRKCRQTHQKITRRKGQECAYAHASSFRMWVVPRVFKRSQCLITVSIAQLLIVITNSQVYSEMAKVVNAKDLSSTFLFLIFSRAANRQDRARA